MASDKITLSANKREILGKKVHALRAEGQTPGVVHDHGKQSLHIAVSEKDLKKVYSTAGKHHPVVLKVEGKSYTTLIKEVTLKPATSQIYHSVFQAVNVNETVKAEIPVQLVGEVPAEKASLLVLQNLDKVEVEALPGDLIDMLDIDATVLAEAGDKITVGDIKVPSGIVITTDPELSIATVEIPKDQIAEADAAQAELAEDASAADEEGAAEEADTATEGGGTESGEGKDANAVQPTDEGKE
jgi:large subunit ribosomal protein L25